MWPNSIWSIWNCYKFSIQICLFHNKTRDVEHGEGGGLRCTYKTRHCSTRILPTFRGRGHTAEHCDVATLETEARAHDDWYGACFRSQIYVTKIVKRIVMRCNFNFETCPNIWIHEFFRSKNSVMLWVRANPRPLLFLRTPHICWTKWSRICSSSSHSRDITVLK